MEVARLLSEFILPKTWKCSCLFIDGALRLKAPESLGRSMLDKCFSLENVCHTWFLSCSVCGNVSISVRHSRNHFLGIRMEFLAKMVLHCGMVIIGVAETAGQALELRLARQEIKAEWWSSVGSGTLICFSLCAFCALLRTGFVTVETGKFPDSQRYWQMEEALCSLAQSTTFPKSHSCSAAEQDT